MVLLSGHLRGWLQALFLMAFLFNILSQVSAQGDPGAAQDAVIERQKLLKAADQIDLMVQQNGQLQQDLAQLKERVKKLESDNAELKKALDDQDKARAKEKEALLKEVSKIVATGAGTKSSPRESHNTPVQPGTKGDAGSAEQGYEYRVEAGQNLWAIAKAYQEKGVKVTVEDIRKANNLAKDQPLKTGQRLFIPKK